LPQTLLAKEVIGLDDLQSILGKRPFVSLQLQNIDKYRGLVDVGAAPPALEGSTMDDDSDGDTLPNDLPPDAGAGDSGVKPKYRIAV